MEFYDRNTQPLSRGGNGAIYLRSMYLVALAWISTDNS
jgi:hypothetical protein